MNPSFHQLFRSIVPSHHYGKLKYKQTIFFCCVYFCFSGFKLEWKSIKQRWPIPEGLKVRRTKSPKAMGSLHVWYNLVETNSHPWDDKQSRIGFLLEWKPICSKNKWIFWWHVTIDRFTFSIVDFWHFSFVLFFLHIVVNSFNDDITLNIMCAQSTKIKTEDEEEKSNSGY